MRSERSTPLDGAITLAFAGRLRASARALDALPSSAAHPGAEVRWLKAYLLAAAGEFGRAERIARAVMETKGDPATGARAAVTLGSILRQTERHAEARTIESAALPRAQNPELRAHLRIGLAADCVGLGDLAGVDRELGRVPDPRPPAWRVRVRLRWVRAERELLAGRPGHASRWARSAVVLSQRAGAQRHLAKSLLFLGAARRELALGATGARSARAAAEAHASLRRSRSIAARIGAGPIERVAGELLVSEAPLG